MILVGKLGEYEKTVLNELIDSVNSCYCDNKIMYDYIKKSGLITDMVYLSINRNNFIDNLGREVKDYKIVLPYMYDEKYLNYLGLLDNKYGIYSI